jgi:hypothetical protein
MMHWTTKRAIVDAQDAAARRYQDAQLMLDLALEIPDQRTREGSLEMVVDRQGLTSRAYRDARGMYANETAK